MFTFETVIAIIEILVCIAFIARIIYVSTKEFKLKGFLISTASIIAIVGLECFLNYSSENAPFLLNIFIAVLVITLLWLTIEGIKFNLTSGEQIKKKFIKETDQKLKIVVFSMLAAAVIFGISLYIYMNNI